MDVFNFDFLNENHEYDSANFQSSFPLFNPEALRSIDFEPPTLNLISSQRVSEIVEDIMSKKVKVSETRELVVKTRGRKAIPKNAKNWDDPEITLKEIIENDLAGEPTQAEIKMKTERLQKMRDTKAKKKAEKNKVSAIENQDDIVSAVQKVQSTWVSVAQPLVQTPQIVFRDGKIVLEAPQIQIQRAVPQLVENKKPVKLTSMSFRTKNHTPKWTDEETRKFYKSLEIFGADFSMIAKLFPTRNRAQLKNKFNKEEKTNSKLIDNAFNKNKVLGKRSIMDRIRNFNKILESQDEINFVAETTAVNNLERNHSNVSTDSMDMRIMEEIQDIFVKEIRPNNMLVSSIGTFRSVTQEPVQTNVDKFFDFENVQKQTEQRNHEDSSAWTINEQREEVVVPKRENLLTRLLM